MTYDYIHRVYGASFYPGDTVQHDETGKTGVVTRPNPSRAHYVRVLFDGKPRMCHPRALKIMARGKEWERSRATADDTEGGAV